MKTKHSSEFIDYMMEDIQKHKQNALIFKGMAKSEMDSARQKQRQLLSYQKRLSK